MLCERLIGQPLGRFCKTRDEFDLIWERLRAGNRFRGEMAFLRADGATVLAEFTTIAGILSDRYLMILRDITDRSSIQQAVNQSLMFARSSWQEAETLRKASMALTEDLRMNRVLDALLQALAGVVSYERAQLFLLEDETRCFLAHEAAVPSDTTPECGLPEVVDVSHFPILRRVSASPDGVRIDDVTREPIWRSFHPESSVRSWIGVPIISSNQVLGLLSLTASNPGHFSADHLALTRSLATPVPIAVQNARLYERAEIYGAELERRVAELRQIDEGARDTVNGNHKSLDRFEKIFRSAPVAISVSSSASGRFLEVNKTFERTFGFSHEQIANGSVSEPELWADPRERKKLIERLRQEGVVRNAVARFRQNPGSYRDTMYSAQLIDLEDEPCVLFVAEDQIT